MTGLQRSTGNGAPSRKNSLSSSLSSSSSLAGGDGGEKNKKTNQRERGGRRCYTSMSIIFIIVVMVSIMGTALLTREITYQQQINDLEMELNILKRNNKAVVTKNKKDSSTIPNTPLTPPPPQQQQQTKNNQQEEIKIEFLPYQNLQRGAPPDFFSAAWWQNKERFLKLDIDKYIQIVEDDAMKPVLKVGNGIKDCRMPKDWLDFCVEHLSKWWKIDKRNYTMYYAVGKLQMYIQTSLRSMSSSSTSATSSQLTSTSTSTGEMSSTLAIIPVGVNTNDDISRQVWVMGLAATITSLLKHGVGRVVVVGYYKYDPILTRKAFRYILRHHPEYQQYQYELKNNNKSSATTRSANDMINYFIPELNVDTNISIHEPFSVKYGETELAYVHTNDVKTTAVATNIPKGALKGLKTALTGNTTSDDIIAWLGSDNHDKYKYIYLTEADQILNTRLDASTGPAYKKELDDGRIIVPHRLQPIPHALDLDGIALPPPGPNDTRSKKGTKSQKKNVIQGLSETEEFVHDLDIQTDSCCDTNQRLSSRKKYGMTHFWWMHGFGKKTTFDYLKEYDFMRLIQGTGIVLLAATEHSRKCHPMINERNSCPNHVVRSS